MSGFDPPGGHPRVAPCRVLSYTVAMATQETAAGAADEITWGDRLRRLRINRGLDQRHFAELIGVAKPTIGKYELAIDVPRNHRLVENSIELRFGAGPADFLRGIPAGRQPTGYQTRGRRHLHAVRVTGGLPEVSHPAEGVARRTASSAA